MKENCRITCSYFEGIFFKENAAVNSTLQKQNYLPLKELNMFHKIRFYKGFIKRRISDFNTKLIREEKHHKSAPLNARNKFYMMGNKFLLNILKAIISKV